MEENKNIRNAGRKKLYNEETVTISTVCPKSQEETLRTIIKDFLDNFKVAVNLNFKGNIGLISSLEPKQEHEVNDSFNCGCYIESGLLKRDKGSKCKMNKQQHLT